MKLLCLKKLSPEARQLLQTQAPEVQIEERPAELVGLAEAIEDAEILLLRSQPALDAPLLRRAKKLKLIALGCSGFDHIDLATCQGMKIPVIHLPSANSTAVAELTCALILQLLRRFSEAHFQIREGQWSREKFTGEELSGKRVGLLGLGEVGRRVALRLQAFEAEVIAHDPFAEKQRFDSMKVQAVSFEELLKSSEILSLHLPLYADTERILQSSELQQLPAGALLVNTARSGLICHQSLLEALDANRLAGAALDVFDQEPLEAQSPLRRHPKLFLTPHLGSRTHQAQSRMEMEIVHHILAFVHRAEVKNAVTEKPWVQAKILGNI